MLFGVGGFTKIKYHRMKKGAMTQCETDEINEGKTIYVRKRSPILSRRIELLQRNICAIISKNQK